MKTPINTNSGKFFELMGYLRFVNVDTKDSLDVLAVFITNIFRKYPKFQRQKKLINLAAPLLFPFLIRPIYGGISCRSVGKPLLSTKPHFKKIKNS